MARECKHPGCNVPLGRFNRSGYCGAHQYMHKPKTARCQICGAPIADTSTSGLCKSHAHAGRRRTTARPDDYEW